MNPSRILIIQLKHLGDILLTTPVIAALNHAWPQAGVSALVPRGMEAMLTEHPGLTEVLTVERQDRSPWNFLDIRRSPAATPVRPGPGIFRR